MESHSRISQGKLFSQSIMIGGYSYVRSGYEFYGNIEIGRFCSIGNNAIIGLEKNAHPTDWLTTSMFTEEFESLYTGTVTNVQPLKTVIGHDCWIGRDAVLMSGVKVGNGAVIGARAIVTKDVPDYAVVVGIPAKLTRYRFSQEIISQLTQLKWWTLSPDVLSETPLNNVATAIKLLEHNVDKACYEKLQLSKNKVTHL